MSAEAYRLTREKIAFVTAYLQETLSGIRVVRAFSQERAPPRPLRRAQRGEPRGEHDHGLPQRGLLPGRSSSSRRVATAAILLYGGNQVVHGSGDVTIGVLVSFVFYLQSFFDPIQQLSQLYTTYQAGMAALDKIFELLDEEPDLVDEPGRHRAADACAARSASTNVSFSLRRRRRTRLHDLDLTVPPGQTVALVGATGAGKSTFAKLVARFYDPTEGRVLIDGHDLRDVTERSLRSQLGIVPQEGFLFSGTIRDNIAFGRADATDEEVLDAAPRRGRTRVHRAAAARATTRRSASAAATSRPASGSWWRSPGPLVADPRILILDEATSNVDVHTEARIEQGLRRLLAGRTAVVIAHRLSTIRGAGRIVVLEHGRIVEQGTHEELLEADGRLRAAVPRLGGAGRGLDIGGWPGTAGSGIYARDVLHPEVLGLAVAVRAQQLEVLETVVPTIAVDVVEFHRQRPAAPLGQTAVLALVDPEAVGEQAALQVAAVLGFALGEVGGDGGLLGP